MLNFGKFLFDEAVTMNGKKIGDENDTSTTNSGSTNTNDTTNIGSTTTPSMGVDDDSDYTKMSRDDDTGTTNNTSTTGSNDDVNDYTQMPRDDDTTSTNSAGGTGNSSLRGATSTNTSTTGGGTDTTTGGTPGITPSDGTDSSTGADAGGAEDEVDDYTKMDRDDAPSGTTPTGTDTNMDAGTDTTTGGTTDPGSDDVDDYTKMPRDDASTGGDVGAPTGTDAGTPSGDASGAGTTGGTTNPGMNGGQPTGSDTQGGDNPQGGGAAEDDNVEDYTQTPRDGEDSGGDPSTEDDPSASGDAGMADPQQELRDLEAKLFSELSPEQLQIKDNELKIQYINLYEDIEKTEQRVNRIVKTENNEDVVAFISKKLDDLKNLVHIILTETYQTQTWLQNMLTYQHCLSIFAGIGELLRNLSRKDNINKNIDNDDKIEDLTNDVITSTNSEG